MADYKYKLSIIIPLYNAEKYIGACLDSIFDSDLPHNAFEVVVVDDGSKDGGPEIVRNYQSIHNCITLLTQENQGQSVARNLGIKQCKGEYVWCVDADDKVESHLEEVFSFLDGNIDIVSTYLKLVHEDGSFVSLSRDDRVPYNKTVFGREIILRGFTPTSVCGHFIRKQFIFDYHLFFVPHKTHQDVELSYRLFAHASSVVFIDVSTYLYILHPNSVSQSKSVEKKLKFTLDDIFVYNSFKKLASFFSETDTQLSLVIDKRAESVLFGLLASLYRNKKEWGRNGITKAVLLEMRKQGIYPLKGAFHSKKHRYLKYFLNLPFIYYPLWGKKK